MLVHRQAGRPGTYYRRRRRRSHDNRRDVPRVDAEQGARLRWPRQAGPSSKLLERLLNRRFTLLPSHQSGSVASWLRFTNRLSSSRYKGPHRYPPRPRRTLSHHPVHRNLVAHLASNAVPCNFDLIKAIVLLHFATPE